MAVNVFQLDLKRFELIFNRFLMDLNGHPERLGS